MKKMIIVLTLVAIFLVQPSFADSDAKILNDDNGFRVIYHEKEIMIDSRSRQMTRFEIKKTAGGLIVAYATETRIPKIGIVIIKNDKIVFDCKEKVKSDAHGYMEKINKNRVWSVGDEGARLDPIFYNYNPRIGRGFNDNDYTYKTILSEDSVIIDINCEAYYEKYVRLVYDKNSYKLQGIINKSGIVAEDKYPIATIQDPDGYTNVRSESSKQSKIIEKIKDGEIFAILSHGNWYKILTSTGKTGYIHKSRIKEIKK